MQEVSKKPLVWVDAHSHLADPRLADTRAIIQEAQDCGIGFFLQGGYAPEDWLLQLELAKIYSQILPVFGLHPVWICEQLALRGSRDLNIETNLEMFFDECLNQLTRLSGLSYAIGEIGLDFRPKYLSHQNSEEWQIELFQNQLELAAVIGKPVILHIVRAQDKALQVWDLYAKKHQKGIVHGFTGTWPEAEKWLERGLLLSVGGALCRPDRIALQQAVRHLPMEKLLIESDSPDQAPPDWGSVYNRPASLIIVAKKVAEIKKISITQVLDKSRENLENLFDAKFRDKLTKT